LKALRKHYGAHGEEIDDVLELVYEKDPDSTDPTDDSSWLELCQPQLQLERHIKELHRTVNEHINDYAAPRNSELCDVMQQRLPKELRGIVYGYLFSSSEVRLDLHAHVYASIVKSQLHEPPHDCRASMRIWHTRISSMSASLVLRHVQTLERRGIDHTDS
jgi:hypothetical protein